MFKTSFSLLEGQVRYQERERTFLHEVEMERLARITQPPKAHLIFSPTSPLSNCFRIIVAVIQIGFSVINR